MQKSFVWVGLALTLTSISLPALQAQSPIGQGPAKPATTLLLPEGPLLPEKFGTWQRVGDAAEQSNVGASALTGAKIFAEDGATRASGADYKPAAGGGTVHIDAIEFGDVTGAYSAFTWWASRQQRSVMIKPEGEQAVVPGQGLLFRSGSVLVMVHDPAPSKQLVQQLNGVLPKINGSKSQLPLLPSQLPARQLAVGSVRYSLGPEGFAAMDGQLPGDILGFDKSAEIVTADYAAGRVHATLRLFFYPTPQIAGERGRAIENAINADRAKFGRTVKLRRDGPMVAFAAGEISENAADALIKSASLHEELTWNHAIQPEVNFNNEIHKTATLLEKIVVFCTVCGAGTILLGLFLGFGRAGVRVLMGKPAAVEPEFLAINLRGIPRGRLDPSHPEGMAGNTPPGAPSDPSQS